MDKAIEEWEGGRLRVYWQLPGPQVDERGKRVVRQPFTTGDDQHLRILERDYRPLGDGWAIRADLPLGITFGDDQPAELRGLHVHLDMRDGRFQCVAVYSGEGAPALTHTVLRKLGTTVNELARRYWPQVVVRLALEDGEVVAEQSQAAPTAERPMVFFGEPGQGVVDEHHRRARRAGREPLPDERLTEVAHLYREAERIGQPRSPYIAQKFPGHSRATIRNWIRQARERGFLGPAPSERIAGERQPEKGESDG